jgi:hypothetical protein
MRVFEAKDIMISCVFRIFLQDLMRRFSDQIEVILEVVARAIPEEIFSPPA